MIYLEYIGIAAFAITGAMTAVDKDADIFGVLFLAVITALGGGIIRDIMLGWLPPRMFTSYGYIAVAVLCALLVFMDARRKEGYQRHKGKLDSVVNIFDAVGLAAFTVSGMDLTIAQYGMGSPVLIVLMGMTTGVGGGMIRDMMTNTMPAVLRKRVYAVASLTGALLNYCLLLLGIANIWAAAAGMATVFLIRILATHYKWNLPKA